MVPELSRQVHIVGFTTKARFIAHSLAPVPYLPPIKILAHNHPSIASKWLKEGRAIDLYDAQGRFISSHPILCPEYIGPRVDSPLVVHYEGGLLDNIIINTSTTALYPTLRALRHAIDNRTILCVVHEGLGYIEKLNEDVFDDPAVRPTYVLGHLTHLLSRHVDKAMSLRNKRRDGQFLISAVQREARTTIEDIQRQHFLGLLSTSRALEPVGMGWPQFLHRKLPDMIWSSVADVVSVILGCRYDQIFHDMHAKKLWNGLLEETIPIVAALPEFEGQAGWAEHFTDPEFRAGLRKRLEARGPTYSPWISLIRRGDITPVDFVNGYFVRRAEELGLDCKVNKLVVSMVKARHQARAAELRGDIPFSLRPYMLDGDKLGGKEFEDVDTELDF